MIDEQLIERSSRVTLDSNDLEDINYQLAKIEKSMKACTIASTLNFLHQHPQDPTKGFPDSPGKDLAKNILAVAVDEFTGSRGTIINGLISMIDIISDDLINIESDLTSCIEQGEITKGVHKD